MDQDAQEAAAYVAEVTRGYWKSAILFAANEIGVFGLLAEGAATAEDAARKLNADLRAVRMLLDALAALDFVTKAGDAYANAPVAERLLTPGRPGYQGNILRHNQDMWLAWGDLPYVLRNGKPRREGPRAEPSPDAEFTKNFIRGMNDAASRSAEDLMGRLDLSNVWRMLDVGGGPGTYCYAAARKNPALKAMIFDLPETLVVTRECIAEQGMEGRVETVSGDFNADPLPSGFDLVLMSQILHSNSPEQCAALIGKGANALNPGGLLVVNDFALEESRTAPLAAALFSVNMLVNTDGGSSYSRSEIRGWMAAAGLEDAGALDLGRSIVLLGRKPA
jgi:SAM-dependent methyltransferase